MKFLFGDKVKVIGGFYVSSIGYVTDYSGVENKYYVEGNKYFKECDGYYHHFSTWIDAGYLEKMEE